MHFVYHDATNNDLYQRHLTSANVLGTAAAFETNFGSAINVPMGVAYDDGVTRRVRLPYRIGTTGFARLAYFDSADNPTVTTEEISQVNVRVNSTDGHVVHALANDGTTLHYLYADNTTQDLQHDSCANNNSAWGTDVNELAATLNKITANVYTRSGNTVLAMVLDDGGTLKYAEIALAGAPAATPVHRRLISKKALTRSNSY